MNSIASSVKNENFDGFNVLLQAVLYGAKTKVMPGQLIYVESDSEKVQDNNTAFVHSVALSTRLSTVTFVLQKRFRRAIHQRKGVRVPKGATFSYFAEKDPVKYANRIGYPVVVKEVFGENPTFAVYDVKDRKQLAKAIKKVKAHLPTTSDAEPASYAQTINLSSAEVDEDGSRSKSEKARFLIEKQISGDQYRVYVVAGKAVASLQRNGGSSTEVEAPGMIKELAERAVITISGLRNGTVDIVHNRDDGPYVVELCERVVIPEDYKSNLDFCDKVFSEVFVREAQSAGVILRSRKLSSTYDLYFHGVTNSRLFVDSLGAMAASVGGSLSVKSSDEVSGVVGVSMRGKAMAAALFIDKVFFEHHVSNLTIVRKPSLKKKILLLRS
ncbi:ATP-grasp domain-containing protein [Halomonas sp. 328]|uniref:hypothetical protein n=1 Tax=Halomonas sp. 328 TaxID=2776704 RepID=UPI0018A77709|nr:hypothetical protein [Halomonas sp. 328]MBF8223901.1 hypothetical protein [Halomonas sp. 328]